MTVAVFLLALMGAVSLGMPIAFGLLVSGAALMVNQGMLDGRILAQQMIGGADNFSLMAIPFFLLVGELMNAGGVARRIVNFGLALVGHIRGGLGYVAIIAGVIFAGLSGSAVADTAALCSIMVPMMANIGYNKSQSAALIGGAGILAPIIPPSIPFIVFGAVSGVSIMKLFIAGIVPGLILAVGLAVMWWFMSRKQNLQVFPRKSFKEVLIAAKEASWSLVLPFIIIVGIKIGVVTPTEAAVVAVVYTMFLCFVVYREITVKEFCEKLMVVAKTTSIIMFLIAAALISAWMIAAANVPAVLGEWLEPLIGRPLMLMIVVNILGLIIGASMDLTPTIIILTPILMPIIAKAGIDPVYFGVVFILNGSIGLLTPPIGTVLNAACGASKITMDQLVAKIAPILVAEIAVLILLILFPALVTVPFNFIMNLGR